MAEQFNAYLKWLGIPLKHQPPNHYRLLGVEPFENDPDVIQNAADRQMAHVRTFSSGKRMEHAERLLQELAAARVTLLNADKKVEYDAELRKREAQKTRANSTEPKAAAGKPLKQPPPKTALPQAVALPAAPRPKAVAAAPPAVEQPVAATPSPVVVSGARSSLARRRQQSPWIWAGVLGGVAIAVCLGVVVLSGMFSPNDNLVANTNSTDNSNNATSGRRDGSGTAANVGSGTNTATAIPKEETPVTQVDPTTAVDDADPPAESENGETGDKPPRDLPVVEPPPNVVNPPPEEEPADEPPPKTTEPDVAAKPARPQPPAANVYAEIEKRVRSLYDISATATPAQLGVVARKLLADGTATTDNANDRYVMLDIAAQTAASAGDMTTAMKALDGIAAGYETDVTSQRLKMAERIARAAGPDEKAEAIRGSLAVIDEATSRSQYKEAEQLAITLLGLARKVNDKQLSEALIERRRTAATLGEMYDKAIAGVATLAKDPDDAAANTAVGNFWIFAKGNWEKGLPHLAKSSDAELAKAAQSELDKPKQTPAQVDLANAWFVLAKKGEPPSSTAMLRRAKHWFETAQADATGLTRATIDRRLEEIEKTMGPVQPATPTVRTAQIVAACDSGFEMYLNGELVLQGSRYDVKQMSRELKSGDVFTVLGTNLRRERGFAAVIKFDDGQSIVTGQADAWRQYAPANANAWFDPRGIAGVAPAVAADGDRHREVENQSGVACTSIWGNNQFRVHLVLQIP